MSIFEYDEEREKEKLRKAEYEAGQKNGIEQGCKAEQERFKCLSEKMQADQRIEELLRATTDLNIGINCIWNMIYRKKSMH